MKDNEFKLMDTISNAIMENYAITSKLITVTSKLITEVERLQKIAIEQKKEITQLYSLINELNNKVNKYSKL